jgi:hypothetical protein
LFHHNRLSQCEQNKTSHIQTFLEEKQVSKSGKFFAILSVLIVAFSCIYSAHFVSSLTYQNTPKLQAANIAVEQAFHAVLNAENAGANITGLLVQLNVADKDLAQAENAYRSVESNIDQGQINNVLQVAQKVTIEAQNARQNALATNQNSFVLTLAFSVIGGFVFVEALFLVWRRFKRKSSSSNQNKTRGGYKIAFVSIGLIGILLLASPALVSFFPISADDQFSELYLLGPNKMAENYPSNIAFGQSYSVYAAVGNHLGSSGHYLLYVKLGNSTDQLPNDNLQVPSQLEPLWECMFSIQNGESWQSLLTFSVSNATASGKNSQINTFQINGFTFNVDKPALRDSDADRFAYCLIFELWRYNESSNSVQFDGRSVNLALNLNANS